MKSSVLGKNTSPVEVQGISPTGFWLWAQEREYFLSFKEYPWFKEARVSDICQVKLLPGGHLYWPSLDIDLALDGLEHPERYPLLFKKNK